MKTIEEGLTYSSNSSKWKVLSKTGDICIVEEVYPKYPQYEVWIIQNLKPKKHGLVHIEGGEYPPISSRWGKEGWTWPSTHKNKAWDKFGMLVERRAKKANMEPV